MNDNDVPPIIKKTVEYVKEALKNAESGHGWYHIERVWNNSLRIAMEEMENCHELQIDFSVLQLSALLHDIADHKFNSGDCTIGGKIAGEFLTSMGVDITTIEEVCEIINTISFKGAGTSSEVRSIEGKIVQDADRLDAIGAIGIARAFSYGGYKGNVIYDPNVSPQTGMKWEEYKKSTGPTINHFYEKLLLIKDRMNTETGKELAEKRHKMMEIFLEQFYEEWNS